MCPPLRQALRPDLTLPDDCELLGAIERKGALVLAVDHESDAPRSLALEPAHAPAEQRPPESDTPRLGDDSQDRDLAALGEELVPAEAHAGPTAIGEQDAVETDPGLAARARSDSGVLSTPW